MTLISVLAKWSFTEGHSSKFASVLQSLSVHNGLHEGCKIKNKHTIKEIKTDTCLGAISTVFTWFPGLAKAKHPTANDINKTARLPWWLFKNPAEIMNIAGKSIAGKKL